MFCIKNNSTSQLLAGPDGRFVLERCWGNGRYKKKKTSHAPYDSTFITQKHLDNSSSQIQ